MINRKKNIFIKGNKMFKEKNKKDKTNKRVQEWMPIADIQNSIVYRRDMSLFVCIRVFPINLYLQDKMILQKIKSFFQAINNEKSFQIFLTGRNMDLTLFQEWQEEILYNTTDLTKKNILKQSIKRTVKYVTSGIVNERRSYIIISQQYNDRAAQDLVNRAVELVHRLSGTLDCKICEEHELIDLFSLFTYPGQTLEVNEYNMIDVTVLNGGEL